MFRVGDEENEYIICPYDKSHNIRSVRMQFHLIKCRKNHTSKLNKMATCPFNNTHEVDKVELDVHVKICPERFSFEKFVHECPSLNDTFKQSENLDESVKSTTTLATHVENLSTWDDLSDVPTYNPKIYAEKSHVLRSVTGLKPSERRAFRAKERARLLNSQTNFD